MEHLLPKMRSKVTYKVEAAIITVDSEKVAILANEKAAECCAQAGQTDLMPKEGVAEDAEISWQEDVEVVKEFVDSTQILEQEDAVKVLESTHRGNPELYRSVRRCAVSDCKNLKQRWKAESAE